MLGVETAQPKGRYSQDTLVPEKSGDPHALVPEQPQVPLKHLSALGTPAQSASVTQPQVCVLVLHLRPPRSAEHSPSLAHPQIPVARTQKLGPDEQGCSAEHVRV